MIALFTLLGLTTFTSASAAVNETCYHISNQIYSLGNFVNVVKEDALKLDEKTITILKLELEIATYRDLFKGLKRAFLKIKQDKTHSNKSAEFSRKLDLLIDQLTHINHQTDEKFKNANVSNGEFFGLVEGLTKNLNKSLTELNKQHSCPPIATSSAPSTQDKSDKHIPKKKNEKKSKKKKKFKKASNKTGDIGNSGRQ